MSDSFSERLKAIAAATVAPTQQPITPAPATAPEDWTNLNIDPELGANAQAERDKALLGPAAFADRYGADAEIARRYQSPNQYADPVRREIVRDVPRTGGEITGDSLRSIYAGLWQGGAGIFNLGARGIDAMAKARHKEAFGTWENPLWDNQELMRFVGEGADGIAEHSRGGASKALRNKRHIADLEKGVRLRDSEDTYNASEKSFSDTLRKIGRDSLIQGKTFVENPAVAGDITSQAVGSLIPSLLASGGTTAFARGVLSKTGAKQSTKNLVERSVTAGTVGAVEGQGAYNSTVSQVNKMTEEQLLKGSEDYRSLRDSGMSHDEARAEVAHSAGNRAQLIQTGLATVAGYGVAKFEGNPLGNTGSLLGTIGSQTAEEAFQSGTGQFSQNLGVRAFADSEADLTKGVGEAISEGALGGFGATGVIKAPQAAAETVQVTGKVIRQAATSVPEFINTALEPRLRQIEDKVDASNPTGNSATSTRIDGLEKIIRDTVANTDPAEHGSVIDALPTEFLDTSSEGFVERIGSLKDDVVDGSRLKTVRKVAEKLNRNKYTPEDAAVARAFVRTEVEAIQEYISSNRSDGEKPASIQDAVSRVLNTVLENKNFKLEGSTPEATEAAVATLKDAVKRPVSIDPKTVSSALEAGFEGSPAEIKAMRVAEAITPVAKAEGTTSGTTRADVRNELVFSDDDTSYGGMPSLNELVSQAIKGGIKQERAGNTEVINRDGDPVDARDSVTRLGNLAQHQINKFNAAVASMEQSAVNPGQDTATKYETLDPRTGDTFFPVERGNEIFINPRSEESVETLRQVREDANLGINAYNTVLEQFGDVYQGQKLELLPEINEDTIKNAQPEIVEEASPVQEATQDPVVAEDVETADTPTTPAPTDNSDGSVLNQNTESKPEPSIDEIVEAATAEATSTQPTAVSPSLPTPARELEARNDEVAVGGNLVKDPSGKNTFLETYTVDPVTSTDTDLVETIKAAENLDYEITPAIETALENVLGQIGGIVEGLNESLKKNIERTYGKDKRSFKEILADNNRGDKAETDLTKIRAGRVLALLDAQSVEDGNPQYDSTLMGLAVLAALDYVMNTPSGGTVTKHTDVTSALGLRPEAFVTPEMWDVVNFGRSASDTKIALSRHIMSFWGAKANRDVSESQSKGIAEAVADEIMEYLANNQDSWLKRQSLQVETGSGLRTFNSYRTGNVGEDLGYAKTVLRDVLTPSDADIHQYRLGAKFESFTVPEVLKKDGNTLIPEQKRQAIKNQQDAEFRLSPGFSQMYDFFGVDTLAEILGFVDLNEEGNTQDYNVNHRKSIEGKNASVKSSINGVFEQLERMKAYAEKNDVSVTEIPVHYRYNVSLNGRFFMQGFNPQSNKLAREMFTVNSTTLDLTDAKQREMLMVAVAQAFDLKVENLGLKGAAKAAESLIEGTYRDAIDAVKGRETLGQEKAGEALKAALAAEGAERSAKVLKALLTVANLETALENGETSLDVDLALELDGKTNGPISSAIQNNLEGFTPEFLALVRRGGLFLGGSEVSPSSYADFNRTGNSADLYEAVGDVKSTKLADLSRGLKKGNHRGNDVINPDLAVEAQVKILELLSDVGDVQFTRSSTEISETGEVVRIPGELTVKRRGTKGPITEQLYGAGEKSIAAGLTNAIFTEIYEEISRAIQTRNGEQLIRMAETIDQLAGISVTLDRKGKELVVHNKDIKNSLQDALTSKEKLKNFTFSADTYQTVTEAIANLYVPAFTDALSETVGTSVADINSTLVEATNNHTEIYLELVKAALDAETEKQRASGKIGKGDELSTNDRNKIVDRHRKYAPIVDVGSSVFNLSAGGQESTTDVQNRRADAKSGQRVETTFNPRSETLSGTKSDSKRDTLEGAGVKILPYNVIANADVSMITDINTDPDMDLQSLSVHDGVETTITSVGQVSQVMNKAVHASWQRNTIAPVLESLKSLQELKDVLLKLGADQSKIVELEGHIKELERASRIRQARIDALSSVQMVVDGVPGAESPFVSEGRTFSSEAEMIDYLNSEMRLSLAKQSQEAVEAERKSLDDNIEKEAKDSPLRAALEEAGDARTFIEILGTQIDNADQQRVFNEIKSSPALQDMLDAGLTINLSGSGHTGGTYDMGTNTVNISNVTVETVLHELVHAATAHQVQEHYLAPETESERGKAISRMESLMYDFIGRSYAEGSVEAHVQAEIQSALEVNDAVGKMTALNEFMAWSLSNEKLIDKNKKKVANDPLSQAKALGTKVIRLMRRVLGFSSNKVFDHILFNTSLILNSDFTVSKNSNPAVREAILRQNLRSQEELTEEQMRLEDLQRMIDQQVTAYLRKPWDVTVEGKILRAEVVESAQFMSEDALTRAILAGFKFENIAQTSVFKSLVSVFSMDLATDKVARLEAQKFYDAVVAKLTKEDFLRIVGKDYLSANQTEDYTAGTMFDFVVGETFTPLTDMETPYSPGTDARGLSDRLGVFMALAQTSPEFRSVLEGIDLDSLDTNQQYAEGTLDGAIERLTHYSLRNVTSRVVGKEDVSTVEALDILSHLLVHYEAEQATAAEQKTSSLFGRMNDGSASGISKAGDKLAEGSQKLNDALPDGFVKSLAGIPLQAGVALGNFLNGSKATHQADEVTSLLNNDKVPIAMRELWSEMRGTSSDNSRLFRMVKIAKQHVSSTREEFREKVPAILKGQFSEKFNGKDVEGRAARKTSKVRQKEDWATMFLSLGRTDISVLAKKFGEVRALNLFGTHPDTVTERETAIDNAKKDVIRAAIAMGLEKDLAVRLSAAWLEKSKHLGRHLATDYVGTNLLRSAAAVAGLYNENGLSVNDADYAALQQHIANNRTDMNNGEIRFGEDFETLISAIDVLASLQAINHLTPETHNNMARIVNEESDGVRYAVAYMQDLRSRENKKTDQTTARINGYKGHMHADGRPKFSLIVAENAEHDNLSKLGYTRVRDYVGPETRNSTHGYYFSASAGLANYNQGVLQTVQQSYNGVHPVTGLTHGPTTAGVLKGDYAKNINRRIKKSTARSATPDGLLPVFTEYGDLIGFERALAPDMVAMLDRNQDFAESLANWSGRIVEEQAALGLNQALIDELHNIWNTRPIGSDDQYVEFSDDSVQLKEDAVWLDNYRLIPNEVKAYAKTKFGGPLMIRKDMINNALGFRSASIDDVFTGRTRLNEPTRKATEQILTSVFGTKARKYLNTVEGSVQTIVSEVKHTIVVKSVSILAANTMSNVVQLLGREVPVTYMAKRSKTKYAEVAEYKRNEEKKIKLRADMLATSNPTKKKALANRIKAIEESERRMSIWPLIEAGEFTTISEGLTDSDKALMDGRFIDWIEGKAAELPGPLSTVARYAMVSRDTALYQGLARGVQYSDFIAKAVYYDFLTENKDFNKDDALAKITDEFINYDLADGRTRTYLESVGLTWFLNFKIRAVKVALDLARNNPVSALFTVGGAGAAGLDVGSAVTDNIGAVFADGRLGYSIGPGMVEAGWNLNLWNQIFGR